jgi:shikimate kinase
MCEIPLPFLHSTHGHERGFSPLHLYQGIALVGLPRTGKTTVGTALAQHQHWSFIDSDAAIARAQNLAIPDLIARDGIAAFRALEKAWLLQLCQLPADADHPFIVLSTGGGMPCHHGLMEQLKQHFLTVHLDLDLKSWLERMQTPPHELTTRLDDGELRHLYQERSAIYHQAHYTLTQRRCVENDVKNVLSILLA